MNFLDKTFNQILEYKWISLFTFLYFSFQNPLNEIFKDYVVKPILLKFSNSLFIEFAFFLIIILLIISAINKYIKGFYFKNTTIVYSIFIVLFYSYIRFKFNNNFQSLSLFSSLKYFDIIYFVFGIIILLFCSIKLKQKKQKLVETISFFNDNAIQNSSEDILNRKEKSLQVARFIKSNYSKSSIAVGIVGKWGEGKTSFMSLIEESFVGNDDYIIVKFKSWLNLSVNSIFNDFFNTVEKEIKPYSFDIAKDIKKYGKTVLSVYKSSTTEILLNSLDLISDNSISEDFENLDKLLNKLGKKVIFFLDDLDRLQSNEVFEILKLIRNTASFSTFNYIVGYDKEYIIEALTKNQIPNPQKYCDKIFINEYYLLPIRNSEINSFIKEKIIEQLSKSIPDISNVFEQFTIYSQLGNIFSSIKTLRDAKRFLNDFFISYYKIKHNVSIRDFIIIKLLKFSYNELYFLLYSNRNKFIGTDNSYVNMYSGGIRLISLKRDDKNCCYDFNESILKKYLVDNKIYNEQELEHLKILFQILFMDYNKQSQSFGLNHNFYKYFEDEIDESEIDVKEYQRLINSSFNEITTSLENYYREGKLFGLMAHLYLTDVRDFDNRIKFENYISFLFYLGRLQVEKESTYFHLDFDYIDRSISNYDDKIVKKFYNGKSNEYRDFLFKLLYNSDFPYIFEMRLCKYLYKRIYSEYEHNILKKKDYEEFIKNKFTEFTKNMNYSKDDFFGAFHRATLDENFQNEINSNLWYERKIILPEVKQVSKEVIKKFPDFFLTDILVDGGRSSRISNKDDKQIIGINNFVLNIFDSYEDFINFIKDDVKDTTSSFKSEFLDFTNQLPQKDDFIEYDFEYLPVKNKFLKIKNDRLSD